MNIPEFLQKQGSDEPWRDMIETSTVFHTPVGDLEVPAPPIPATEEVKATYKSNLAPMWLIFPKHIINTQRIVCIRKAIDGLRIFTSDGQSFNIIVTDLEKTWNSLQKVFADGVSE